MSRKLFGTDGIRGLANRGDMSPEIAFRIGAAIAYQARQRVKHVPRIVVGKDTRLSGYLFETAVASGICAQGGEVLLSGPLPTPAIAHLTTSMRADAGVVISASHNPYQDNGIKIFGSDGFKLADEVEHEVEQLVFGTELDKNRPTKTRVGRAERLDDAPGRYVAFVKASFPNELTLEGVRIVVDAAHGAAYRTAPLVFSELGATTHAIGVKPDGKNINHRVGALHPETCAKEVRRRHADLGIALDGDADRVIMIDEKGNRIDGDVIMALCATRMLRANRLRRRTLVATVMSNLGLERALEDDNGKLLRCSVGDRYVVETMRRRGLNFGGEQSGHLIFLDHATTGDGLVAAMQVLAIVLREGRPLSELASQVMERVPQVLVNVTLPGRRPLEELPKTTHAIALAKKALGKSGRVLVRWSGTEPKLRVMIEGPKEDRIQAMAQDIASQAERELEATPAP
ncbi:MAG: phosphoglucosamine mutase [Myxococcales bacterium]|nr:phosphoglucosamine mutase [Myxococcales bacterium]MDH3484922.1 phosphoglucosamine mutase [Myxococcales bacterium]